MASMSSSENQPPAAWGHLRCAAMDPQVAAKGVAAEIALTQPTHTIGRVGRESATHRCFNLPYISSTHLVLSVLDDDAGGESRFQLEDRSGPLLKSRN